MFKIRTLLTLGTGAALAYFLDPQQGARRRQDALLRIQGGVGPQARGVVKKVSESAPQMASFPKAGRTAPAEPATPPAATDN